jgi:hypothetical protein
VHFYVGKILFFQKADVTKLLAKNSPIPRIVPKHDCISIAHLSLRITLKSVKQF